MARIKYTKLTWQRVELGAKWAIEYRAVTPSGIAMTRVTFGVGLGSSVTAIAWDRRGTPAANYWDRINGCRSTYRNLVEVEGGARVLAERTLYKMYPEFWLNADEYQQWVCECQPEEDIWAVSQGYL